MVFSWLGPDAPDWAAQAVRLPYPKADERLHVATTAGSVALGRF